MAREKLFSLGPKDFKVEFYTAGGPGGSGKDTSNTACRITHLASGAVGQSQDERSQPQNKKRAFERMVESKKFKDWLRIEFSRAAGVIARATEQVERDMNPSLLRVEGIDPESGRWSPFPPRS